MRIIIFTSNALRHKYIANNLAKRASDALVISECQPYSAKPEEVIPQLMREHFSLRSQTEEDFFGEHASFQCPTMPILYKEVNLPFVYDVVKKYKPDAAFVFGSSIIKEPLLSLIPRGRFVNLHLGLSPYYRGSGTNFWPLVNKEPEYVGTTLLHIDSGIDTGDIIAHVRPEIAPDDTVHTVGMKTIAESKKALLNALDVLRAGKTLPRVKQWACADARVYKKNDFNEEALKIYYGNLKNGMFRNHHKESGKKIRLIFLE